MTSLFLWRLRYDRKWFIEKAQMWIAWHLPAWLVMWATVRLVAHATTGKYGNTVAPELGAMEALQRWGE